MTELINEEKQESTSLKILKFMGNLAIILIMIVLVIAMIVFAKSRKSGEQPSLFNHKIFIVQSNSMNPEFKTGSLILVNTKPDVLVEGDIVTYKKENNDVSTTHRIVEIVEGEEGYYITRGDANNINDPRTVSKEDIIGRVSLSIPLLGYLLGFLQMRGKILIFGLIPCIVIIGLIIKEIMSELKNEKISL
jgi:signal peptidase